jgi:hypothetical protein
MSHTYTYTIPNVEAGNISPAMPGVRSPHPGLLEKCHLNPGHYNAIMFEIGAQFLQNFCRKHFINEDEMYQDISQEASFTFWDWWKDTWAKDDYSLLNMNMLFPGQPGYESMKELLVDDRLYEKELYHIIFAFL